MPIAEPAPSNEPGGGGAAQVGDRPPRLPASLRDPLALQVFTALAARATSGTIFAIAQFAALSQPEVEHALALLQRDDVVEAMPAPDDTTRELRYRARRDFFLTDEEWAELPAAARRTLLTSLLNRMDERMRAALARGGFDAPDVHVSWLPSELDAQGYEQVTELALSTLERARDIQAEVVQRGAESGFDGERVKTDLMLLHFRREAAAEPTKPIDDADQRRARVYQLSEDLNDALAMEQPDWRALVGPVRELAALVQLFATSPFGRPG